MKLDNMFKKTRIVSRIQSHSAVRASRPEVPEGLLRKCNKCGAAIIAEDVKQEYYICPKCGGYFRVHAYRRIQMVIDEGTFEEWNQDLIGGNPVNYKGYPEKVQALQEKTGLKEAVVTGKGKINGRDTVIAVCDGRFLMASMGWAVGEKITRAVERATEEKLPVIIFACSGGARMQEGITSLMQMAKNFRGAGTSQQGRTALCKCFDRTYDRWCDGKFCDAGGYHSGGTRCTDRFRRSACH